MGYAQYIDRFVVVLIAYLVWVPESEVIFRGVSKAIGDKGFNLSQILTLVDHLDQFLGMNMPWRYRRTSQWMPASDITILAVIY